MILFLLPLAWLHLVNAGCYEPSLAHPLPDYVTDNLELQVAFMAINNALSTAIAGEEFASTSFSVDITSSKESLWSRQHTALQRNSSRPDIPEVNGDALYRIASITKTFTVLGILYQHDAGNLSLDDTIDTYIEELRGDQKGTIPWKDITLRSLASQLSGIPREFAQSDLINVPNFSPYPPEDLGLPPISREGLPKCDEYRPNYEPPCTRNDLLEAVKRKAPVFAPNQKSTYSNVAFELLGLVLERVTNKTYEQYINDAIFEPLNMSKSTLSKPPDSAGVIPLEPQYWDVDEGIQEPTGGIYSCSNDLSKYLRYILTHYNGITHALNWAHPVSPSEGLHTFYGMPWEIFRTDKILLNSKRVVRFITKGGGLPGYTSIIIMVPEYDLGITILIAGNPELLSKIQEIFTLNIVRSAEAIAIRQLQERYSGTYTAADPEDLNTTITLAANHRGLVVTQFISNSTDMFKSRFFRFLGARDDQKWYAQLVPTLLYKNETEQTGEKWRLLVAREHDDEYRGIWDDFCPSNVDNESYGTEAISEFIFWKGESGNFESVDLPAFRVKLSKREKVINDHVAGQEQQEL